jgi:dephospho-CoA kinase
MLRVGLTGGIASGKSTVARMLEEQGVPVIDTDVIAREVVARGEPGLEAVREIFGEEVIAPSGELDRPAMRRKIFADSAERRRLETLLHPLIRQRTITRLKTLDAPYVVVVVPLLVETGFSELVNRVLVVDCPVEQQIERLMHRDGMERAQSQAMLDAQIGRTERLAAADDRIDNGRTLEHTQKQVRRLHRKYLRMSKVCRPIQGRAE